MLPGSSMPFVWNEVLYEYKNFHLKGNNSGFNVSYLFIVALATSVKPWYASESNLSQHQINICHFGLKYF